MIELNRIYNEDCLEGMKMAIACNAGNTRSSPMVYEKAVVRGKIVYHWRYYWDRIADEEPGFWMPLPQPPTDEQEDSSETVLP